MKRTIRWVLAVVAGIVLGLGLGCLNYTKAETLEHHLQWAAEHGAPEPGPTLFRVGVLATIIGAGLLGFALGRGTRAD